MYYARRLSIWPTLPLNVYFKSPSYWLPYPLSDDNCRVFSKARHAIWNACGTLGLGSKDVVLVPAYHHGCEIEALLQAGVQIRYYELTELLEPDLKSLESQLTPEVKVFYLIHYLGFPQDAKRWRRWCDENHLLLFEDAAQSFLTEIDGEPVGSFGHAGIFCLYKTYGIPDGGAVITMEPPARPSEEHYSGRWKVFKRHINWMAERSALVGSFHLLIKPFAKMLRRKMNHNPNKEFEMGNPFSQPASLTTKLFPRLVDKTTAERRRQNYQFLLNHHSNLVPLPFIQLPKGASPFAFPIETNDADALLKKLRGYGIEGLLFWRNAHPSLPAKKFPLSMAFRNRVIAVPVHQELTRSELLQISEAVDRSTMPKQSISIVNDSYSSKTKNNSGIHTTP
jgi:dTDP-4-amino-4,6-dideoxygalactose transaminase